MSDIHFHSEDVDFNLRQEREIRDWIRSTISVNEFNLKGLNFIFCSDDYLLDVNKNYLNHEYYTDIVTFDHSENESEIEGDIFISIDRVTDNAEEMNNSFENELHRVIIHGILHLLGNNDKSKEEKTRMRKLEDHYLALRNFKTKKQ